MGLSSVLPHFSIAKKLMYCFGVLILDAVGWDGPRYFQANSDVGNVVKGCLALVYESRPKARLRLSHANKVRFRGLADCG